MKRTLCRIVSIIMAVLTILSIMCAVTVTGSGVLNLSNIARCFFIGFAIAFGVAAVITGRYGWKAK